ncbi:sensor histidine kinase [Nonomuraea dietziae]|uniref:sensor histidine kinase n=1 Tax=Nonomuraea dietziae TaxID=65515 RepID=UPI0033CB0158
MRFDRDLLLAAVVAAAQVGTEILLSPGLTPLDYALLLGGTLVLALRRRFPVVVLAVTVACMLAYTVRMQPGAVATSPVLIAVYTTVRQGKHPAALAGVVLFLAGLFAFGQDAAAGLSPRSAIESRVLVVGWLVAAAVIGEATRAWSAYLEQVEQRAAEAERTREETALRRAGEERLRIARELHDSLTHSISIIKVQAGVAAHLARKRGEEVPASLIAIQEAGADAMRELRATLEVLRSDEGSGLEQVPELVNRARAAGLPAKVEVSGSPRPVPAEVDRAAYRIVQEALTNVSRHAGPASASVRIGYLPGEVIVQIDDDGAAVPDEGHQPGIGLTGMRERVAALGGRLRAEARPEGGFTVRAELPVVRS